MAFVDATREHATILPARFTLQTSAPSPIRRAPRTPLHGADTERRIRTTDAPGTSISSR